MARIYTVPNFNLLINFWTGGHNPTLFPVDVANVPGQRYVNSRSPMVILWHDRGTWLYPVILRLPLGVYTPVEADIWQQAGPTLGFYLVQWVERIHKGFPNEYLAAYSLACTAGGTPIATGPP